MAGPTVVIDGIRYRVEDAEARGLIGERPVPPAPEKGKTAPARSPKRPANKAAQTESKD